MPLTKKQLLDFVDYICSKDFDNAITNHAELYCENNDLVLMTQEELNTLKLDIASKTAEVITAMNKVSPPKPDPVIREAVNKWNNCKTNPPPPYLNVLVRSTRDNIPGFVGWRATSNDANWYYNFPIEEDYNTNYMENFDSSQYEWRYLND